MAMRLAVVLLFLYSTPILSAAEPPEKNSVERLEQTLGIDESGSNGFFSDR